MSNRINCRDCRFFTSLGREDSGLSDGWTYQIGRCNAPKSLHGGRDNVPEWCSCHLAKRARDVQALVDKSSSTEAGDFPANL
jgi:hypothetical protein